MLKLRQKLVGSIFFIAAATGVAAGPLHRAIPSLSLAVAAASANSSGAATPSAIPSDPEASDGSSAVDFTTRPNEPDEQIRKADRHLNAGRQFYFQGNLDGARREFDSAVDVLLSVPDNAPDRRQVERRLDEICELIYRFDVEKLGAGQKGEEPVLYDKAPIDEISHMTFPVDPKLAPKLQSELNQTASGIPLDLTDPVLSYVHYFSTESGKRTLLSGFRRSGRYRPMVERIFQEEGVPQELIYLAQAESGFLPRALSHKKAVGMWQFISDTGNNYNLSRTANYDERFDPEKATRAAAKHLKYLYARYQDWYLAMAAYNCGPGAVDRAIERTGYADYWELLKLRALPKETANYVPIIVAMTIMAKNPKDYGLENIETDPALEYDSIRLVADTNVNLIADATMQPVSAIRDLNPALLRSVAPKGFEVHVPKGAGESTQTSLASVPAEKRQAWRLHHVAEGDTLANIARSYHLPAERIVQVNRDADAIEAGDVLLIPAVFHEEVRPVRTRSHATTKTARSASSHSGKTSAARAKVAVTPRVPSRVLQRKAVIRTASLE